MNLYYKVSPSELIFLTPKDHLQLHTTGENNPMYGKSYIDIMTPEAIEMMIQKKRKSMTGHTHREESKKLMSDNCWFNKPGNEEKKLAAQKKSAEVRRKKFASGEITIWNKGKKGLKAANKGSKYMNNGLEGLWVSCEEVTKYIELGYKFGYIKKK